MDINRVSELLSQLSGGDTQNNADEEDQLIELQDDEKDMSIHSHRGSVNTSSWKFFEQGALRNTDNISPGGRSPLAGRLGGSIVLSRRQLRAELMNEETSLLFKEQPSSVSTASTPPTLLQWIFVAVAAGFSFAFYNIFIKMGSATIHPILGGVVLQFTAAIFGTLLLTGILLFDSQTAAKDIHYDKAGILWSIMAGLAVGLAEMLSFFVSSLGVQASQSIPIIIGGSVVIGSILGILLLKENMMSPGILGIILLVSGIAMVATDPGDKVQESGGADHIVSPPLYVWIGPALLCASAYASYNLTIKLGSASINPLLGAVILQFVAAIFGSILLGAIVYVDGGFDTLMFHWSGFSWAVCAGVSVGAAETLSFITSGMGVPVSQSIPVIIGGSVLFGALLGLIVLAETLMLQGWGGVCVLTIGIVFVAIDPGEKMEGH